MVACSCLAPKIKIVQGFQELDRVVRNRGRRQLPATMSLRPINSSPVDWTEVESSLDRLGFATLPQVLAPSECDALAGLYADDALFRSRIDMARFRFGVGEYKYFAAPLPRLVDALRHDLYARLAPVANQWRARLNAPGPDFPPALDAF